MPVGISAWLAILCLVLALMGCIYALSAALVVRSLGAARPSVAQAAPDATILKPLHGAEPQLYDNLAAFCRQRYHGRVQIVLGAQDRKDPCIDVVRRLAAAMPHIELELVIDEREHGPNRKVSNLVNMAARIRYDMVVMSDSDIRVEPDYLSQVAAALEAPGAGLVTCLYRGEAHGGVWAALSAMAINYHFLPGVLIGLRLRLARPCFGSTIALKRDTLQAIGGFAAFVRYLADDYAIGEAVRGAGLRVVIPRLVVAHVCSERSAAELIRHELRWARTIRAVDPWGFLGSAVTHPLPFALLAALLQGFAWPTAATLGAAIACRLVLQAQVDHTLGRSAGRWWLGPLRDLLSFVVFFGSFFVGAVSWRGHRYKVRSDGTLTR